MSHDEQPIIVIKKINKSKQAHHGGAWKIAYADFVTAMMAFFMLLWLLSLLNKFQLQGVSAYFQKPLSDLFVGSKNSEQYKNQVEQKVLKIKKAVGGEANSKLPDSKQDNPAVKSSASSAHDGKDKGKGKGEQASSSAVINKDKPATDSEKQEKEKIKRQLEISLQNNSKVQAMKDNLSFDVVKDGVKISLHDSENNQMFALGKADFKNYARDVVTWLSHEFNKVPKKIIIIGHTDAYPYDNKAKYSNWELSTDRANAVRYLLIADGMDDKKIIRVEGAAAVSLKDEKNGDNPINRRVEIIVLTDEAAQRIIDQ